MRRVILFLLTLLLASGTVAGSLAHATEDRAEASLFVAAIEAGCVSPPAAENAEPDKEKSSPGEKQQAWLPWSPFGRPGGNAVGSDRNPCP